MAFGSKLAIETRGLPGWDVRDRTETIPQAWFAPRRLPDGRPALTSRTQKQSRILALRLLRQNYSSALLLSMPLPNTQVTTFTVGPLYVHAMSSAYPETVAKWYWGLGPAPTAGRLLAQIHPHKESIIAWPPTALTDRSGDDIAGAFKRYTDAISLSMMGRRIF